MLRRSILVLSLSATPLLASQPISKSMAECAGLIGAMEAMTETPDRADWLRQAKGRWQALAVDQAEREGLARAQDVTLTHAKAKQDEWLDKGLMLVFSQDFRDWSSYCRKLGRAKGLKLPPLPK